MTIYSRGANEAIFTDKAPKPMGQYSQAIRANGFIFLCGQIGIDPTTNVLVSKSVYEQTEQIMRNIGAILDVVELDISKIVKTTIFVIDIHDFEDVNQAYTKYFPGPNPPARSTVQVAALRFGAKVEIEAIAVE